MSSFNNIHSHYKSLDLSQRFDFFGYRSNAYLLKLEEKDLSKFLKLVALDNTENSNIRKQAIEVHTECVLLKKLKPRHELNLLIDSWQDSKDVSLEVRRLKDLFFFYEEEPEEIKEIYQLHLQDGEAELESESFFQLGLITLLESLRASRSNDLDLLQVSYDYFSESSQRIENRTDADFFKIVISLITDLLSGRRSRTRTHLASLSTILFQREIFSFSGLPNSFCIGFYRALSSLERISNLLDSNWLNYRDGFKGLHYYICEIKNLELKHRLSESSLKYEFSNFLESQFFEPYFAISQNAELSKIKARISEIDNENDELSFLNYLEEILEDNLKKKLVLT